MIAQYAYSLNVSQIMPLEFVEPSQWTNNLTSQLNRITSRRTPKLQIAYMYYIESILIYPIKFILVFIDKEMSKWKSFDEQPLEKLLKLHIFHKIAIPTSI